MNVDDEWWCSLRGDEIDRNTAGDPPYDVERVADWIVERLGGKTGRVLDYGAGTGRLTEAVRDRTGTSIFYCVEIAPEIRERLRLKCPWARVSDALPPRRVDGAYSVTVFQHLDPDRCALVIREGAERLQVGGRFVFQLDMPKGDHTGPHNYTHDIPTVRNWCMDAGLAVEFEQDPVYSEWKWATAVRMP